MTTTLDSPQIASHHLKHVMEYAFVRGVSRQKMLEAIPYTLEDICQETNTVSTKEFYAVLEAINKLLNDELMGIRAGRFLTLKALGLVYQISLETATVEEALFYLKNHLNTTFPIVDIDTEAGDSDVLIQVKIKNNRHRLNRIILENLLTVIGRELQMMSSREIRIQRFTPYHTSDYPESWSHSESFGLQFEAGILRGALTEKSRLHLDILIPEYLRLTESLQSDGSFVNKVKISVLNLADPGLPDLGTVAASFNLTPRTLQRRLHSENSNFRQITDELKQTISDMLLLHKRFSVADVSFVLGYSEPAAFIHSFKKWHGVSPQRYREGLQ